MNNEKNQEKIDFYKNIYKIKNMKIGILGAGNWGTTLAIMLSDKADVNLWTIEKIEGRENTKYLPGYKIPDKVNITYDFDDAIDSCSIIILAVPSQVMRDVAKLLYKKTNAVLLCVSKGLEKTTLKRMSEVLFEETGVPEDNICVLAGPSIAREVIRGVPTSCVCACKNKENAKLVQSILNSKTFRVYTGSDVIGAELGGALKNIIAIAAGICDGLGLGANTKGALLTRGIREIIRLGVVMGANTDTFAGLSGIGDLITTSFSTDSRNHKVGELIGKGYPMEYVRDKMVEVAEGIDTTSAAVELSERYNVSMPITQEVYEVLFNKKSPLTAIEALMARELKPENL